MLKFNLFFLAGLTVIALSSCVPVLSYSTDSYVGSLDQCLNIEGTYERENYYRNYRDGYVDLDFYFGPGNSYIKERKGYIKNLLWERSPDGKKDILRKAWVSFRVLDNRHLEITYFNELGQSDAKIVDMDGKQKVLPRPVQSEEFVCNQTSWQRAYSQAQHGESSNKSRLYSKTTKLPDGTLRMEAKYDAWGGALGLYTRKGVGVDRIGYFRKVDLTVDDIRAMNDKARRAIAQYDQLATSPPPQ